MKDYLKMHASQAAYQTWLGSTGYVTPNVSVITGSSDVLYNSIPKILDILWSDGTTTKSVRPTTDGVTPIGLCIASKGFFGTNEKARFMALKYAGGSTQGFTPGNATGSTTHISQSLQWTLQSDRTDIVGLTNYSQLTSTINTWSPIADYRGDAINSKSGGVPMMLYTANGTWIGLEQNNTLTNYALGDINGKQNTTIISDLDLLSSYPAFASVLNYYTPGTQAGDWYVPAAGELAIMCANQSRINTVLNNISSVYGSDCISRIYVGESENYWSSTEHNENLAFCINFYLGTISTGSKALYYPRVIPMLQK